MKTCSRCNKEKEVFEFKKNKTCKDGTENVCKECNRLRELVLRNSPLRKSKALITQSKYRIDHATEIKAYRDRTKLHTKYYMSEYAKANKLSLYVKNLEWAKLHPDKIIQYKLKYTQKSCSTLNSSYLRNLIYITSDICRAEITSEMIELKRISLINKRIIKNKTYETI